MFILLVVAVVDFMTRALPVEQELVVSAVAATEQGLVQRPPTSGLLEQVDSPLLVVEAEVPERPQLALTIRLVATAVQESS